MSSRVCIYTFHVEPVERTIIGITKSTEADFTLLMLDKSDIPFGRADEFIESVYFHTTIGEWCIKTRYADGSKNTHEGRIYFI